MYNFGEKHPVLFEIILFIAALAAAAVITVAGSIFYLPPELSSSIGRIIIGVALFFIYNRAFKGIRFFKNPVLVLPALLFSVWNIVYYLSYGKVLGGPAYFADGFITAIAPAIFEEVIFREIFIYNLKKKGNSDFLCLIISAILFSAVHLTNLAGMDPVSVFLQVGYSFVIGLVFAAIYLKNGSLFQIVAAHFLTDYSTRIFTEAPASASNVYLIAFVLLLIAEAVFAVLLTVRKSAVK